MFIRWVVLGTVGTHCVLSESLALCNGGKGHTPQDRELCATDRPDGSNGLHVVYGWIRLADCNTYLLYVTVDRVRL